MNEVTHLDPKANADTSDIDLTTLQQRIDIQVSALQEAVKRIRNLQPIRLELDPEPTRDTFQFVR
ncbi:MAG: hypothetical protein KDD89_10245 [Anaerolineales bacterium]|nr:hypothetical protein [Anaerolineales bacterium]